jgi:mediator of RNA polymerase II transcription subunit 17
MSHARDLLTLLLSSSQTKGAPAIPTSIGGPTFQYPTVALATQTLSVTNVTKPPPIPSVAAFNVQLSLSSKDKSLRKAASLFKDAANTMNISTDKSEKFWGDALRVKTGNWGLVAAPLPYGGYQMQGRSTDRSAKDFMICFGLEDGKLLIRFESIFRD